MVFSRERDTAGVIKLQPIYSVKVGWSQVQKFKNANIYNIFLGARARTPITTFAMDRRHCFDETFSSQ